MSESSRLSGFLSRVIAAVTRWLDVVRRAVFSPGRLYPDPSAVLATSPQWTTEVNQLLVYLDETAGEAWEAQSGREYVSTNSFVRAQLAMTENLLVRIPDDVYNRVFAAIADGQTNGDSREQIAEAVDRVLIYAGSDWWENRAQTIANTEVHRAWQAGTLAAAQYFQPATGPSWVKEWKTDLDGRERASHRRADGQVRRLSEPFQVGGSMLMYPGDAAGPADEVINCRCDMIIRER